MRRSRTPRKRLVAALVVLLFLSIRSIRQSPVPVPRNAGAFVQPSQSFHDNKVTFPNNNNAAAHSKDISTKSVQQPVFPRILHLDPQILDMDENQPQKYRQLKYPMSSSTGTETPLNQTDEYLPFEQDWFFNCQEVRQIQVRSTCNAFHEHNYFHSPNVELLSLEGNWRSVWRFYSKEGGIAAGGKRFILKLLQMNREFDREAAHAHAMDSRIMEQLSASPHIVQEYGFCGQSVLTDFATSSGSDLIKDPSLSWSTRLRLARDVAQGLAELHALQPIAFPSGINASDPTLLLKQRLLSSPHPSVVFSHHDINIANVVSITKDSLQWNDFHLGIISKDYTGSNSKESCAVPIRYGGALWRAPEEIQNATGHLPQMQPADMHSLANLLYTIMTKHQPWTHLEREGDDIDEFATATKKLQGVLPYLPTKYKPQRLEARILWEATKACYQQKPENRPTAYELALSLRVAYDYSRSRHSREWDKETIQALFAVYKEVRDA